MQQVKTYKVSINQDEINAINDIVDYILANELISYEETEPSERTGHIYDLGMRVRNWIDKGGEGSGDE